MMEIIQSVTNEKIKKLRKLRQKKYRDQRQLFIVEGVHLLEEALKSNCLKTIVTTDYHYQNEKYEIIYVSEKVMKTLSNYSSLSKYLAVCQMLTNELDYQERMIVLDDIQDPGNLGTIIRTSIAFKIKNVVLGLNCVDLYNPKVIQASQGAIFSVNVIRKDLLTYSTFLKERDYLLIGTSLSVAKPLSMVAETLKNREKTAFFFGNEGQGMNEQLLKKMDQRYYIEIENIDSLNVVCAVGIILYQWGKKNSVFD